MLLDGARINHHRSASTPKFGQKPLRGRRERPLNATSLYTVYSLSARGVLVIDSCYSDHGVGAMTFEEWTPPDGSSFVINATELRGVNFTMTPTKPAPPPRSGRHAGAVEVPVAALAPTPQRATEYVMD